MSETITFEIKPLEALPESTRAKKASKYDAILNDFLQGKSPYAEINVKDKEPNYVIAQLQKRIKDTKRKDVKASMRAGKVYLSKEVEVKPKSPKKV